MKCKNRTAALLSAMLLAALLLCTLPATVRAHEIPDARRKGTITVEMEYDGETVTGGTLAAYQVGRIQEEDGNYRFAGTEAMEGFSGSFDDPGSPELAEEVAAFVEEHKLPACAEAENEAGKVSFSGLELGLYLIVQTEASDGYEPLKPFLVAVPMNQDGRYVYEVNAVGKFQLHQEPEPTAPPQPSEPSLPQTGQMNWPVPVLVVSGLALFSAGWALRFGKKKNGDEA